MASITYLEDKETKEKFFLLKNKGIEQPISEWKGFQHVFEKKQLGQSVVTCYDLDKNPGYFILRFDNPIIESQSSFMTIGTDAKNPQPKILVPALVADHGGNPELITWEIT